MSIHFLIRRSRRCLGVTTHIARIAHSCDTDYPDCSFPMIFPGDRYRRECWVHWWNDAKGKKHSWLEVKKFHDHPDCEPDPSSYEGHEENEEAEGRSRPHLTLVA